MFLFLLDFLFFFFNDTATTEIYTLSLHDALPIYHLPLITALAALAALVHDLGKATQAFQDRLNNPGLRERNHYRSEEHTSELQSRPHLVCRLLLEKKKYTYHA